MFKLMAQLSGAIAELKLALKEFREMIAALEALLSAPNMVEFEKFRKEALDFIKSVKTKGI